MTVMTPISDALLVSMKRAVGAATRTYRRFVRDESGNFGGLVEVNAVQVISALAFIASIPAIILGYDAVRTYDCHQNINKVASGMVLYHNYFNKYPGSGAQFTVTVAEFDPPGDTNNADNLVYTSVDTCPAAPTTSNSYTAEDTSSNGNDDFVVDDPTTANHSPWTLSIFPGYSASTSHAIHYDMRTGYSAQAT